MGYLPSRAANGVWNQPRREKCVTVNKAEQIWIYEEHFDMEVKNLEFALLVFNLLGPVFPHSTHCVLGLSRVTEFME